MDVYLQITISHENVNIFRKGWLENNTITPILLKL